MSDPAFTPLALPHLGSPSVDPKAEAERARARGYADGYAEGQRKAREEAAAQRAQIAAEARTHRERVSAEHQQAVAALVAATRELRDRTEALTAAAADRVEELAVELAEAILGVELASASSASHALRRALKAAPAETWQRVTFNPRDHGILMADVATRDVLPVEGVDVVASADVGPGGAVVELVDGSIDLRVAAAIERVRLALAAPHVDGMGTEGPSS